MGLADDDGRGAGEAKVGIFAIKNDVVTAELILQ